MIYRDMLRKVFNAEYPASLKLCLEKASGEITMSVGEAPPFGLVMVGDPEQLLKRLEASSGEQVSYSKERFWKRILCRHRQ